MMLDQKSEVMIVEDEAIISLALSRHLGEFGYRITDIVHTGEEAIKRCLSSNPDIVLMDIVLKGEIDGIDAAEKIRAEKNIPIVFLTAYSDDDTVRRAAATAPAGYVTKPYDPREIRATIETAISKATLEKALIESEYWYASLLRSVGDAIIATDDRELIQYMNPAAERMTEVSMNSARNASFADVVRLETPAHGAMDFNLVAEALNKRETQKIQFGSHIVSSSGLRTTVDDTVSPILGEDGRLLGAVMVLHDVSREIELRKSVQAGEQRFQSAFMHSAVGSLLINLDDSLRQANRTIADLLGYSIDELIRLPFSALLHRDHHEREFELRNSLIEGKVQAFSEEWRFCHRDGHEIWGLTSGAIINNDLGESEYLIYQIIDIGERKRLESKLMTLANYDSLTGLVNRARLQIEIQRAIASARRHHTRFGLIFVDLDNFKHVNDSLGHDTGDALLKEIGKRVASVARATDITARLGGDEFVLLINDVDDPQSVVTVAEKLQAAISMPAIIADREIRTSASAGISVFPEDGGEANKLLRNADSALYKAKESGRGSVAFYSARLTEQSRQRLALETSLRRALERKELFLEYQPIVDIATGEPVSFEALLRWRHGDEVMHPGNFIQLAEETGLIVPIGDWVMRQAIRQAARWRNLHLGKFAISINVSVRQIRDPSFIPTVSDILAESGFAAGNLWIEITESLLLDVEENDSDSLDDLRKLGVTLAVDDFGVGYSSLHYLKHINPRVLKIDRGFIEALGDKSDDHAIVSAIIAMARKLGTRVVAEGIENAGQLAILEAEGCDAGQGHFFQKPVPEEFLMDMLNQGPLRYR